jgi:hypothetical protein
MKKKAMCVWCGIAMVGILAGLTWMKPKGAVSSSSALGLHEESDLSSPKAGSTINGLGNANLTSKQGASGYDSPNVDFDTALWLFAGELRELNTSQHAQLYEKLKSPPYTSKRRAMLEMLLRSWGQIDPHSALSALETFSGYGRVSYVNQVLAGWARKDPQDAWTWGKESLAREPQGPEWISLAQKRFGAMLDALTAAEQYQIAAKLVSTTQNGGVQGALAISLGREWGRGDSRSALNWIDAIGDDILKLNAYQGFSRSIAEVDPDAATKLALSRGDLVQTSVGLRDVMFHFIENKDYATATKWMLEQQPNAAMDVPYQEYINNVIFTDPDSAITALSRITDQVRRDETAAESIKALSNDLPDRAINLALQYVKKNPVGEASKILTRWAKYDYEGASKYIASNPTLSDDARKQLTSVLAKSVPKK